MADLSKIKLNGTNYNLKDEIARPVILEATYDFEEDNYVVDITYNELASLLQRSEYPNIVLSVDEGGISYYILTTYSLGEPGEEWCQITFTGQSGVILQGSMLSNDDSLILTQYSEIDEVWDAFLPKEDMISFIGNTGFTDTFEVFVTDNSEEQLMNNFIIQVFLNQDIDSTWNFNHFHPNGSSLTGYARTALTLYNTNNEGTVGPTTVAPGLYLLTKTVTNNTTTFTMKPYLKAGDVSLSNLPLATSSTNGLMSSIDKQVLDNLNPNVSVTYSNVNSSTMAIMNAKQENLVDLLINEQPHILAQIRTNNLLNVNDEEVTDGYLSSSGVLTSSTNNNDHAGPFIPVNVGQDIYYTGIVGETTSSSINRRLHVYNANKQWIKQLNFAGSLRIGDHWSTHGVIPSNGAYVRVSWGITDINVMISVGAPSKYEPYYLTPFEEITSASFQIAPNSDMTGAVTYTTTVPSTITDAYGFKYNPILGKIYLTTGHIASYNGETLPGYWWSDRDIYEAGHSPSTGAEVIYLLADEDIEEYSYTPLIIPMFYQKNYFVINNGEIINITYYAETLAAKHFTVYDGVRIGATDIDETNVIGWNHAADEIDLKAPINSPIFTGSPQAPTPNVNVNSERIATTAFVQTKMGNIAPIESTGKASKNYNAGEYLMLGGYLFKTTTSISLGTTFTSGTNIERTTVADELLYLLSLIQ